MTGQVHRRLDSGVRAYFPELVVAAAAIALYARTVGFDFVFDDRSLLGPDGPRALGNGVLPYRPLRYLSYLVDARLGGGAPGVYHATNVVLHAATGAIVARLARRLGGTARVGIAAGLLFVAHPLAVEAVAYVAGRRDLLAGLFGYASVLLWTSPQGLGGAAILALLLAGAAKESGALFVVALAMASALRLGPPLARARIPLMAAAAALVALPIAYGAVGPVAPSGPVCAMATTATTLATHYALHLVVPLGLAVEYPYVASPVTGCAGLLGARALAGFLLLGLAFGAVVATFRDGAGRERASSARGRIPFAWALAALWLLALASVIGTHEPGADRHAYPLVAATAVAVAVGGAELLERLSERGRSLGTIALVIVVVAFAALSFARAATWRDELALWTAAVAAAPASGRAQHNLAGALLAEGKLDAAAAHVRRARELGYAPALIGDAAIACARGRKHRGRDLLARARLLGLPAGEISAAAAGCGREK